VLFIPSGPGTCRHARWYNPRVTEQNWGQALARTRKAAFGRIANLLGATQLDQEFWDDLEAGLIQADLGMDVVMHLIDDLRSRARAQGLTTAEEVILLLKDQLAASLQPHTLDLADSPTVIMLIGVNGSGKTTTAARLGMQFKTSGRHVLLAAADTYRAAAGEQLGIWGERLNLDVIRGEPGTDAGAVVHQACQQALREKVDVLLVDTSGRMHTEHNLMEELKKLVRVAGKVIPGAPHEILLVLDATTGQNGLQQARTFAQAVPITAVVLAKLDSSAKGGVGFAVQQTLGVPIAFVGLGEKADDLSPFEPQAYADGLLKDHREGQ